jgi:hypothetical protein
MCLGGGPDDANHTRILDISWPGGAEVTQQQMLSNCASAAEVDSPAPDMFTQLEMLLP